MALFLLNNEKVAVDFQKENPSVLAYPLLPGSHILSFQTKELSLLIKELVTDFFTIRYNLFTFTKNQAIESKSQKEGLHSRVMLQNDLHYSIQDIGNIHQPEGAVTMLWSQEAHCTALYEGNKEYRTLDIFIAPGIAEQLSFFFPQWSLHIKDKFPQLLLPNPCFITPAVRDVVTAILECPYDEQTSQFYFDLKIREYLYIILEQQVRARKLKYRFTPYEIEQIHKAKEVLLSNLNKPPLTIRELARKVALNECKLKAGFKQYFHVGVFEYFQQARMEKAKQLLLHTNKPLKDICVLTGYPRMTNFITAFRKHFGYTPASLRRSS